MFDGCSREARLSGCSQALKLKRQKYNNQQKNLSPFINGLFPAIISTFLFQQASDLQNRCIHLGYPVFKSEDFIQDDLPEEQKLPAKWTLPLNSCW